jgi:hypothetical protein
MRGRSQDDTACARRITEREMQNPEFRHGKWLVGLVGVLVFRRGCRLNCCQISQILVRCGKMRTSQGYSKVTCISERYIESMVTFQNIQFPNGVPMSPIFFGVHTSKQFPHFSTRSTYKCGMISCLSTSHEAARKFECSLIWFQAS